MGGAFIAVADDATAASWNPAGLVWLDRPEISVVGANAHLTESNRFGVFPDANDTESMSATNLNYLSAAYPFSLMGRNMVVSVNYQHLFNFDRQWDFSFSQSPNSQSSGQVFNQNVDFKTEGGLSAIGLAYCLQVSKKVSLGMTFNIWDDDLSQNSWEKTIRSSGAGTDGTDRFVEDTRLYDKYDFSGYNFNFGLFVKNVFDSRLSFGAVIKTPFKADLDHSHSFDRLTLYPDLSTSFDESESRASNESATLDMPLSFGVGVAFRFNDKFTLSFDLFRTEWDDYTLTDESGRSLSPITGKLSSESDIDATHQVRMGGEYLGFASNKFVFPLCFGMFYDPAPAPNSPDDFYGVTVGSGITDMKRFSFDVAYRFRFGNDTGSYLLDGWRFSQDVQEHSIYSSLIVYF